MNEKINFLKSFINDINVASVTPSSKFSVKKLCGKMDLNEPRVIVEYGPGSGVYSRYILEHLHPQSKFILVETNEDFVKGLQELNDLRVEVVCDSAENIFEIMQRCGNLSADYVISGIPFSYFSKAQREKIIRDTYSILKPGGKFLAYQFLHGVKGMLKKEFDYVKEDFELRNVPPLFMFEAFKNGVQTH